jgi:hypothetical protein
VVDAVRRDEIVGQVQVPPVEDLLVEASDHGLVLFRRHVAPSSSPM